MESKEESGFYCDVCKCIVKDSLNYLDHVNGKKHNRNLGISLKKFTDCTLEEVKAMLAKKKRERELGYKEEDDDDDDDDDNYKDDQEEEEEGEKKGEEEDEEDKPTMDPDEEAMAKLMGFSSFSSSKR